MKKYVIKATALAIGALVGGAAVASVDFSVSPFVATTDTFASELNYAATTGTAISGALNLKTKLGFGVSSGQTRFIRIDLSGAKLAVAAAGANVTNTTNVPAANAFANVAVVQGGGIGDTYVIYQVTGAAGGHAATDLTTIAIPSLNVTNGNASSVNATYALYADAVAAANQTAGQSLSTQSGALFTFGTGIKFKVTTKTQTATVADAYKKFTGSYGPVAVGSFDFDAVTGVFDATGAQVALASLVGANTKAKFTGDFTFTSPDGTVTPANLFLANVNACGAGAVALTSIATDNLSASHTLGATALNKSLCVTNANGANVTSAVLNVQSFSVDFNPVNSAVGTGSSVTDPSAVTLGGIDHDGTTLTAPFATIHPDYLSRVVLTSTYGADAAVTATVTAENGATCSGSAYAATLKKKSQLVINVKDICPALSSGATRLAVTVSVAAPRANIDGVYNVMNYDQVTGKTNSLISYILVVPGTN